LIAPTNKNSEFKSLLPVFPLYLFLQINLELDNWTSINSSYGVSRIVMFSKKFTSIPNNIINLIQDKLDDSGLYKEEVTKVDYQKGDFVLSKKGILQE